MNEHEYTAWLPEHTQAFNKIPAYLQEKFDMGVLHSFSFEVVQSNIGHGGYVTGARLNWEVIIPEMRRLCVAHQCQLFKLCTIPFTPGRILARKPTENTLAKIFPIPLWIQEDATVHAEFWIYPYHVFKDGDQPKWEWIQAPPAVCDWNSRW